MITPTDLKVSFTKVPNRLVKYYKVEVSGFTIPNVPFIKTDVWPVQINVGDQTGDIKDMESGWKYKIRAKAIYANDEEGYWSTTRSIQTEGPRAPRFVDIVDIKDRDCTVTWSSAYQSGDAIPANLKYKIQLYQLLDIGQKLITTYTASASQTQHTFVNKTLPTMRYRVVINSHVSSGAPKISTPKSKAFRSNSGKKINARNVFYREVEGSQPAKSLKSSTGEGSFC